MSSVRRCSERPACGRWLEQESVAPSPVRGRARWPGSGVDLVQLAGDDIVVEPQHRPAGGGAFAQHQGAGRFQHHEAIAQALQISQQAVSARLARARERLRAALEPLGVQPVLETREIAPATFLQQPDQSNRIWIGGRPLEDWLGARTGSSRCCDACGDEACRTLEINGAIHEVIPEALVVRAGLIAASQLLDPTLSLSPSP